MLTARDILTSGGKYLERLKLASKADVDNATNFAETLNRFLKELGYTDQLDISSGYRPPAVNAAIPGAAKKSLHQVCLACDFAGQALGRFIRAHDADGRLRRKHGLFMEALESTTSKNSGWTHLDKGQRPDRPSREFTP